MFVELLVVVRVPRDPVVVAEIFPNQNPEPLQNLVADPVPVLFVDGRQSIDVEQDEREELSEASGAFDLLGEHCLQHWPRVQCRERIDETVLGRLEEGGNARYVMLCDPAATTVEPLVARLLLDPSPDLAPVWQRAGFGRLRLAEILAAPASA